MSGRNWFEKLIDKLDNIVISAYEKWRYLPIILILFLLGFIAGVMATYYEPVNTESTSNIQNGIIGNMIAKDLPQDKISPYDWIKEEQIHVYNDRIVIELEDAEWAGFTDTNSMDPIIDIGSNAIELVPRNISDIHVGDIISFKTEFALGTIIHRVVNIGEDTKGWYCITKGDNINNIDPGKVRFDDIQRIVVAVIY